jgi:predicted MFS family arabinose efflux permease
MSVQEPKLEKRLRFPLFVAALFLAFALIITSTYFSNIALVDIAKTLKVSVGTISQRETVGELSGLVIGLVMGVLAVRFKHKSLLLLGVASYSVGTLVYFFAPNYATVLFSSVFLGIGAGIVQIMVFTLIGEFLPLQKRGWVIGLVSSSIFLVDFVTAPATSIIAPVAGWRAVLLWVIFPFSLVSLLIVFLAVPSKPHAEQIFIKPEYAKAFKQILTNKSAIACVISAVLLGLNGALLFYFVTFWRMYFSVSLSTGASFALLGASSALFGSLVAALMINRAGRRLLTISAALFAGILHISFTFVPNLYGSLALWAAASFFVGLYLASFASLVLEQVPGFRGTMMSLYQSFRYIGLIMGASISGLILNLYVNNFHIVMVMGGGAAVVAAAIVFLFAKDPTKSKAPSIAL